jgi:hypothetical protein
MIKKITPESEAKLFTLSLTKKENLFWIFLKKMKPTYIPQPLKKMLKIKENKQSSYSKDLSEEDIFKISCTKEKKREWLLLMNCSQSPK